MQKKAGRWDIFLARNKGEERRCDSLIDQRYMSVYIKNNFIILEGSGAFWPWVKGEVGLNLMETEGGGEGDAMMETKREGGDAIH